MAIKTYNEWIKDRLNSDFSFNPTAPEIYQGALKEAKKHYEIEIANVGEYYAGVMRRIGLMDVNGEEYKKLAKFVSELKVENE